MSVIRALFWALVAVILGLSYRACAQELPDAPDTVCIGPNSCGWHQVKEIPPAPVTFLTFRKSWQDPPLRTNREEFHSKLFWVASGALFASFVVDNRVTHNAREHWGSEAPAIGAVIGLDYVMDRFFSRSMSVEAPIYGIQHYLRDISRGSKQ
jgi:hypothetical protein